MTSEENPATLDPQEFARLVKRTPADQLDQLMTGGQRLAVLDQIFARMPGVFRADKAGSTEAVVHWRIDGRPDGGQDTYELVIANGTCTVSGQARRIPRLALTIGAVDFLKVVTGNANPMTLFLRGRMKAKGDLGLATRFPGLFEVPRV